MKQNIHFLKKNQERLYYAMKENVWKINYL